MTTHHETKEFFLRALDHREESREVRIDEACGSNADRARRIRALVAAHEAAEYVEGALAGACQDLASGPPPFQGSGAASPGHEASREIRPGDQIGPYRVQRFLGKGGFGLVFLAEQTAPVRRMVAIKVLRAGMDSRQVVSRFEVERQALAIMDHPNIARVFDAGTTEGGRPYFVMEYVDGVPITQYCDQRGHEMRERLELFRSVCLALQHAHQKGVVHRDIKPNNVIVTTIDGQPVPKVIDFGIAKATERSLTDDSLVTHEGLVIGTPSYMSPEQAGGDKDIDTRSDVYSLGALLYELLCGEPPFPMEKLRSIAMFELQRRIREDDPAPPSLQRRKSATTAARTAWSQMYVSPEVDWIVMKCLEKDRVRRYATANALAEDVSRFLRFEPIEAARPSRLYRLRKMVRRHRAASFAIASGVCGLLLAAVGTSAGMIAAQESAVVAELERARVMRLSVGERLDVLRASADTLWPMSPERTGAFERWLDEAADAVATLDRHGETRGHREQLAELRSRARAETNAEVAEGLASLPRHAEWERLDSRARTLRRAERVRAGLDEPEAVAIALSELPQSGRELNDLAWTLVDPGRTTFGEEARGLALARAAHERVKPADRPIAADTLAWALFAVGLDSEALTSASAAVDDAPADRRAQRARSYADLEAAVARAQDAAHEAEIVALETEAEELHAALVAERPLRFDRAQDAWWYRLLSSLVAELEDFSDPDRGLVRGVSPDHGWGVARRLEFALHVEQRSISGPRVRKEWLATIERIERDPTYDGLSLTPQLGLVPIGSDPDSGLQEFAHLASGETPTRRGDGQLVTGKGTGLVFVLIPGGRFDMGAQSTDPDAPGFDPLAQKDEGPVHEVEVAPYFLSKYEMTQGQWLRFAGTNPSRYDPTMDFEGKQISLQHPVEQVTWHEATQVLARMRLFLPTEAQWELAARAGSTSVWSSGIERESLIGAANLADESARRAGARWPAMSEWPGFDDGFSAHAPVGSYAANAFGLHDVHGNVWEWVQDGYLDNAYARSKARDPLVDPERSRSRVNRGGGFANGASSARSSNRDPLKPDSRMGALGVRPARAIDR